MVRRYIRIVCNRCDEESPLMEVYAVPGGASSAREALESLVKQRGWKSTGLGRHECPRCQLHDRLVWDGVMRPRAGFTLVELLVVLAIVAIVAAAAVAVLGLGGRRTTLAGADLLRGELAAAVARAQRDGVAGLRLEPDPAFPARRLADGSIDPSRPLAFGRAVPLAAAPGYSAGRVAVYDPVAVGYPAGFVPPPNRLVLEQDVRDADGSIEEPTAWAWNVRLGDRVELLGRGYTVCGPMAEGPADGNVEMFVNYSPTRPALDRGDGPAEWLYLVDGADGDGDGWPDPGWDGRDQDGDGLVDEADEWSEPEAWGPGVVGLRRAPYVLRRRPAPAAGSTGVALAGALVDATGWAEDAPPRSRLPVDRMTGAVDLVVHADGRVEPSSPYAPAVPAVGSLARPFLHFWISGRESIGAGSPDPGALVTVNARTGLTAAGDADPADPEGTFRRAEGGGL